MPKIEIELPEAPEGYEYTGEFRRMQAGDFGIDVDGFLVRWPSGDGSVSLYFILRKKRWVPEMEEEFYYIDDNLMIDSVRRGGIKTDLNMWKTEEAAENVLKAVKTLYESLNPETGLPN